MKVALIHDYLAEYGGAERVLEALHALYPDAPVYTAFVDSRRLGVHWNKFADWDIRTTWLTRIPGHKRLYSPLRVWAPSYFRSLDLSSFDLAISSSNAYFAKAVVVPNGKHICYCHTPPRSLYGYNTMSNWQANPLTRIPGEILNHYLRMVDFEVAQKVDYFVANSQETASRIAKFYRRDATIIYPPVAVPATVGTQHQAAAHKTQKKGGDNGYFLYVNRLAYAKHPELAVAVCKERSLPLKVVGEGKMKDALMARAPANIEFLGGVSDSVLGELYMSARALIYPVEDEDFGIVPVEAMGHGVPVIAHNSGGPRETVLHGKTGVLFDDLSVAGLSAAIDAFETMTFSPSVLHAHAQKFSSANFAKNMKALIDRVTS